MMFDDSDNRCAVCVYHKRVMTSHGRDWCCCNPDGEYYGLETCADDVCDDFEEKEGGNRR